MGRPRMNRVLPKYASEFIDRHGKARIRLRRTGWKTIYIQTAPGSPEFTQEYKRWETEGRIVVGEKRVSPGTFDDLITRFYRSQIWSDLKATTKVTYRGELERFRAEYGDRSAAGMTARHISNLMTKMESKPSAANNLKKRLAQLFDFAIILGMRTDNPAKAVRAFKARSEGFRTWQEEQIAQFEAFHPVGTTARLAFDLALYTAQRKSDLRTMGPQHIERGKIKVTQIKTGKPMMIPIHRNLARSIAATPSGHLAFLVSSKGAPFTEKSFGMWFMRQSRKAGVTGYPLHGLRKAASRRMAELGLSNQMIKSITGHSSDSEVARYTREAEQEAMAEAAFKIIDLASPSETDLANLSETAESKGVI